MTVGVPLDLPRRAPRPQHGCQTITLSIRQTGQVFRARTNSGTRRSCAPHGERAASFEERVFVAATSASITAACAGDVDRDGAASSVCRAGDGAGQQVARVLVAGSAGGRGNVGLRFDKVEPGVWVGRGACAVSPRDFSRSRRTRFHRPRRASRSRLSPTTSSPRLPAARRPRQEVKPRPTRASTAVAADTGARSDPGEAQRDVRRRRPVRRDEGRDREVEAAAPPPPPPVRPEPEPPKREARRSLSRAARTGQAGRTREREAPARQRPTPRQAEADAKAKAEADQSESRRGAKAKPCRGQGGKPTAKAKAGRKPGRSARPRSPKSSVRRYRELPTVEQPRSRRARPGARSTGPPPSAPHGHRLRLNPSQRVIDRHPAGSSCTAAWWCRWPAIDPEAARAVDPNQAQSRRLARLRTCRDEPLAGAVVRCRRGQRHTCRKTVRAATHSGPIRAVLPRLERPRSKFQSS